MEALAFTLTYIVPAAFAATGAAIVAASALKAAGRNPVLGISFIDAIAIIGFVAAIVGKVM